MTESYSVNAERGVNALKIKYFTFSGQDYGGVNKKLFSQAAELIHLGLDVELILIRVGDVRYPSYPAFRTLSSGFSIFAAIDLVN